MEKCLSLPDKEERLYEVKKVFAGGVKSGGNTREASDENDEIELLQLAEDLLDKLAELLGHEAG